MRYILFLGIIIGLMYVLVLKKEDVERLDLDAPENKVQQVEDEVNRAMEEAQQKLDEALKDN